MGGGVFVVLIGANSSQK